MKNLPLLNQQHAHEHPPATRLALEEYQAVACSIDDEGCLTCGDVAVPVTVSLAGDRDVLAVDSHGNEGRVAVELVGPVAVGDRLLVHAGIAIERLEGH
ncbi:MAG: HypC/HybG/HupF family hydrogenase formation chaperone [Actinomycetota bacterium]